jgi:DNA-binding IclR family transcriptional regulator
MTVNDAHEPGAAEERVLDAFKAERQETGESRMSPSMIRDRVDDSKQTINYALSQLTAAGWIEKKGHSVYEFVDDPREGV